MNARTKDLEERIRETVNEIARSNAEAREARARDDDGAYYEIRRWVEALERRLRYLEGLR